MLSKKRWKKREKRRFPTNKKEPLIFLPPVLETTVEKPSRGCRGCRASSWSRSPESPPSGESRSCAPRRATRGGWSPTSPSRPARVDEHRLRDVREALGARVVHTHDEGWQPARESTLHRDAALTLWSFDSRLGLSPRRHHHRETANVKIAKLTSVDDGD